MIAEVIETARQRQGALEPGDQPAVEAAPQPAAASGPGVTVQVSAPPGATIDPGDTVFVLARNADSGSRMPIAVQRLSGAQLPFTLRLDDSNSMAGQKLSQSAAVIVAVQVSPTAARGGRRHLAGPGRAGETLGRHSATGCRPAAQTAVVHHWCHGVEYPARDSPRSEFLEFHCSSIVLFA